MYDTADQVVDAAPASEALARGLRLQRAGQNAEALRCYQQILAVEPQNQSAIYLSALAFFYMGHHEICAAVLKDLVLKAPNQEKAVFVLAKSYELLGQPALSAALARRFRELTEQPAPRTVHVMGDSHSQYCFSSVAWCEARLVGYITMHRVGRDGLACLDFYAQGVRPGDTAVLLFGEIDTRLHIGRQRDERGRALEEVVDDVTGRYFRTIAENERAYNGVRIIVGSVVPPSDHSPHESHPKYGTLSDRVAISGLMNDRLRALSAAHGYGFLDLHRPFALEDGSMNPAFTTDTIHVRKEFFRICELALRHAIATAPERAAHTSEPPAA